MRETVSTSGFAALDKALAQLPKATARTVLKRTLVKAGEPIAETARQLVPRDSGQLARSISVSAKIKNKVGASEFAAAMKSGLGKSAAVAALRDARREASGLGSFAEIFVGPASLPQAHMIEFGTVKMPAQPYMRPAWDMRRRDSLDIIRAELGNEIIKTARRLGKSKRSSVDVKYRASLAAMMAAGF